MIKNIVEIGFVLMFCLSLSLTVVSADEDFSPDLFPEGEVSQKVIPKADVVKPVLPRHTIRIGFQLNSFYYEEPGLMDEEIDLYGFYGSYIYHGSKRWMLEGDFSLMAGEGDYDGQTQRGRPLQADTDDSVVELRGLVGYDLVPAINHVITPYTGLGYRFWYDEIDGTGGYQRERYTWYLPIGVRTHSPLAGKWFWGIVAEYDLFLEGEQKSYLSDVHPGYNDPVNKQDSGYGLKFSVPVSMYLRAGQSSITLEPYYEYWDIDDSDISAWTWYGTIVAYGIEPENTTSVTGLRITFDI
ncbi:MAG: porin family protein [Desulfobacterales bacterium]|nr:porin family protein [Desulfobacterales bacterium]